MATGRHDAVSAKKCGGAASCEAIEAYYKARQLTHCKRWVLKGHVKHISRFGICVVDFVMVATYD